MEHPGRAIECGVVTHADVVVLESVELLERIGSVGLGEEGGDGFAGSGAKGEGVHVVAVEPERSDHSAQMRR